MSEMAHEAHDEARRQWDERHRSGDFEGRGPNPVLVDAVERLPPGRALELACGSGTNAVWLAGLGWQVTAVDWSPVALANARLQADAAGVSVDWQERNLFDWLPPASAFDLVLMVYLHMPPAERRPIYAAAAAAVAPGGRLVVIGHDRSNATEGEGGPPDPDRLFTAEEIGDELLAVDPALEVQRAEVVRRRPRPERGPIDALLVVRRDAGRTV
jgi:SAM-dependent methyltransferase